MSNIGKIVQVIGPVVDVDFSATGKLPAIYNALEITLDFGGKSQRLVCEVQSHLGDGWVRSVSMISTDGLKRGMDVLDTGGRQSIDIHARECGHKDPLAGTGDHVVTSSPCTSGSPRSADSSI
jgi:F-type H+-transporting ATPase subunit beta